MHSFCLPTSMELILRTNCSVLYLYSDEMKFEKFILGKKSYSFKYKTTITVDV